jgi:hypothetical protein
MPNFGSGSLWHLGSVDSRLQEIAYKAIKYIDFAVTDGYREQGLQDRYFAEKKSRVKWPHGKHNSKPSKAVHFAPWHSNKPHIHWKSQREFSMLAGRIQQVADQMGYQIRWGGDWDMDDDLTDQHFNDLVHYEILGDRHE